MIKDELDSLKAYCEAWLTKAEANKASTSLSAFLSEHPLSTFATALGEVAQTDDDTATTIARAFKSILRQAPDKEEHLDTLLHAAAAATQHPSFVIRRLGCNILQHCLDVCTSDVHLTEAARQLLEVLQDIDTGVAQDAEDALCCMAVNPSCLRLVLSSPACKEALSALVTSDNAVVRHRAQGILVGIAAASAEAASAVVCSGFLQPMLAALANPRAEDLICSKVMMEQVAQLLEASDSLPPALTQHLVPGLLGTLHAQQDAMTLAINTEKCARLVAAGGGAAYGCDFITRLDGLAQGKFDPEPIPGFIWDSLCIACQSDMARQAVCASTKLLPDVTAAALGRNVPPSDRVSALHALANVAGADRLGPESKPEDALLPSEAEDKLRTAVYENAVPERNVVLGPAQSVFERVQQPVDDIQIAACRLASGLCCRAWFAVDVCKHDELYALLSDPRQGSARMCKWRFAVVLSLAKATANAQSRQAAGQQAAGADAELAKHAAHWAEMRRLGPYGANGAPTVEAVPDVADQAG